MYKTYWQLEQRPFENSCRDKFYYPAEPHQGAMHKLRYAVENHFGAVVLAGAAGSGKTLLVQNLHRHLPKRFDPFVHMVFPLLPVDQLLTFLADELGAKRGWWRSGASGHTMAHSIRRIQKMLVDNVRRGRHAVVALDEAHLVQDTAALEAIRLLLNFEVDSQTAMTLIFIGQPEMLTRLDQMRGLEERIGLKCMLKPLTVEETICYVNHRLKAAGAKQTIFDSDALEMMHRLTGGIPRRINRLCDLALLVGYAEEQPKSTAQQLEAVSEELVTLRPES